MAAAAIPLITTGISALAGLFGSKPKPQVFDSKTETQNDMNSTTTPNLSSQQQDLINNLIGGYKRRLASGTDLSGYTAQGLRQIGSSNRNASAMSKNLLATRGLSNSPYAAYSDVVGDNSQHAQSADFLNSMPMLQRQLQDSDLQSLMKVFSLIPTGQTTTGGQHTVQLQHGTGTPPSGSGVAGTLSGLGAGLGAPANGTGQTNASAIAQALSGIFGKKSSSDGQV